MKATMFLALALAAGPAGAQWGPTQSRFLAVKGWTGTFSTSLKAEGSGLVMGFPGTFAVEHTAAVVLGEPHGLHSGPDTCVMRYDDATAYRSQADSKVRYIVEEAVGTGLCNGFVGTGVNDSGHQPQSRYGDARSGRGFCRSQILVNDAVTAPRR